MIKYRILQAGLQADITLHRYAESEGSDFGGEEDDSDAEAPRE